MPQTKWSTRRLVGRRTEAHDVRTAVAEHPWNPIQNRPGMEKTKEHFEKQRKH
jgi:hypothetical protein